MGSPTPSTLGTCLAKKCGGGSAGIPLLLPIGISVRSSGRPCLIVAAKLLYMLATTTNRNRELPLFSTVPPARNNN